MREGAQGRDPYRVHWLLVAAAAVGIAWRWRKLAYWGAGLYWASRLLLLAFVAAVAILASLIPSRAFAQNYPVGPRDPGNWYYCFQSIYDPDDTTYVGHEWSEMECEHILWTPNPGGGGYASVLAQGSVSVDGGPSTGEAAKLRGYVVPARGVKSMTYSCEAFTTYCPNGVGSVSIATEGNNATGWAHASNWSLSIGSTPTGSCGQWTLDVAASRNDNAYGRWWSPDPFPGADGNGITSYPYFEARASTTSDNRSGSAGYSCQVTGWTHWVDWETDPANPNPGFGWEPDLGDLVPVPTPIATSVPITNWIPVPWVPITNPVSAPNFDFTGPGETECYTVVPGQSFTWDSVDYGWPNYELCIEPYVLVLNVFGFDVAAYASVALAYLGLVIIYGLIKSGG